MDLSLPSDQEWTIEFQFQDTGDVLRLPVEKDLLIGRIDPRQAVFNGLDLTPLRGAEFGVSRRHALISWEGNQLSITDLNSDNGTMLNGIRLTPEVPFKLETGDELYIGHLKATLRLNTDMGQSTLRAKRIDFDTTQAPPKARGQKILIVEDDADIGKLYDLALRRAGFTTHICRDVVSALRVLNQMTPSLIILDLKLPGVHGLELCRYVRRDTEYPALPVIVVSALSDQESIQESMKTEVDAFLAKPANMKELVRVVSAIVFKNEADNPSLGTKKLAGTASLDHIEATSRDDTIVFFIEGKREPLGIVVQPQVTIGRASGQSNKTHVDLDPFGAFDKGVSRLHARIKRIDNAFILEDLNSSNGTFVNGKSLEPKETVRLKNGDELRLGELRMHVYLLEEPQQAPANNARGNVA